MAVKDQRVYLLHLREVADRVLRYAADGEANFREERKTRDAIAHNLDVIGEVVKALSPELLAHEPDIRWQEWIALQDELVRRYYDVDYDRVWETVTTELPRLRATVARLIDELGGDSA